MSMSGVFDFHHPVQEIQSDNDESVISETEGESTKESGDNGARTYQAKMQGKGASF